MFVGVPVFILFVLLNLVLGILGDAYAEEKENLGELNEPTLMQDFSMAMSYRYGRLMGVHPSFDQMIQTLKAVRKPTTSKAVEVLASALGDDAHAPKGGDDDAKKKKRASLGGKGKEPVTAAGSLVKNTPEASARARERSSREDHQQPRRPRRATARGLRLATEPGAAASSAAAPANRTREKRTATRSRLDP